MKGNIAINVIVFCYENNDELDLRKAFDDNLGLKGLNIPYQ